MTTWVFWSPGLHTGFAQIVQVLLRVYARLIFESLLTLAIDSGGGMLGVPSETDVPQKEDLRHTLLKHYRD